MAFLDRVEILVRKPAPIEAPEETGIESNPPSHPPVHPAKRGPNKSAAGRTAKTREIVEISSPEAPPPKQAKGGKAKSSVQAKKTNKRKAAAQESPEEDSRPTKSLVVPFKSRTRKSTPSSLQDDKIDSPKIGLRKSRSSLASARQVPSGSASPLSIQNDGTKTVVKAKPILAPSRPAKGKTSSSTHSGKNVKEKLPTPSANPSKPKRKARTQPEDTRTPKTPMTRKSVEKNLPDDVDSDVPLATGSFPIFINGEVYVPPKLGEGTSQRPTKEAMRKEALDRFGLRLQLAKSDFLALCRSRGELPTRKELEMRAFPKDFQFEPFNQTPLIPRSPAEERKNVSQAEAAYAFRTGNWSPDMPKTSSSKKKKNSTAKTRQSLNKEKPKVRKEPTGGDS